LHPAAASNVHVLLYAVRQVLQREGLPGSHTPPTTNLGHSASKNWH